MNVIIGGQMGQKATPKRYAAAKKGGLAEVGVKYDSGKPRMSLVPPEAIIAMARVLGHGAEKYETHNWLRGLAHERVLDATLRHLAAYQQGQDIDEDSGLPVLWHAMTELAFLITYKELEIGEDDRRHVDLGWE